MKIRTKTGLTMAVVLLCTIIGVYLLSQTVLTSGYVSLEEQTTIQDMRKVVSAINDSINSMDVFASDYAQWDDTYAFIENNNTAYIQNNLVDSTFRYSNLNFMIYVNSTGGIVYAKAYDQVNDLDLPVSQELLQMISGHEELWRFDNQAEHVSGILTLSNSTAMISSEPIVKSDATGPVRGAVFIGKYIDQEIIDDLSISTHLPLVLYKTDDANLPDDFRVANSTLSVENSLSAKAVNATTIGGYALMTDVFSNPAVIVRAEMPRSILAQGQTTIGYFLMLLSASLVIVFGTIMILLEKGVLSRLSKLSKEVGSLGDARDLSQLVTVEGNDEIASLARALNDTTLKLTKAERFASIGELATMVGHDLRNPLQGIRNATYFLRTGMQQVDQSRRMLDEIEKSIIYSDSIVRNLVEYSQELRPKFTRTTPKAIAAKALLDVGIPNNINVLDRIHDETEITVDTELFSRALANLIQNAVEAMPKGGTLTVENIRLNDNLEFKVSDTGCGFPEEFKSKIGNPLVTRKARGMGFGLAITKRILEAHKGSLQAESINGKGSTFKIVLPLTGRKCDKDAEQPSSSILSVQTPSAEREKGGERP